MTELIIAGYGVVETRSNAEAQAERALADLGYSPLVVRYTKLLKGSRYEHGRQVRSRHDTLVERPFIPGYLFLPLASGDDATLADTANGVRRIFRQRDADGYLASPRIIRASIVEQVRRAALEKDETPKAVRTDIKPGDKVRTPLGIEGTLISLDEVGRARYMAELFGGHVISAVEDARELELVGA